MIVKPDKNEFGDDWAYGKAFIKQHKQEFGFTLPDRDIIVDDVRVRGIGKTFEGLEKTVDQQLKEIKPKEVTSDKIHTKSKVYFEARQRREETPIYKLEGLDVGDRIKGPAIIADGTQTIVVTPGAAVRDRQGRDKKVIRVCTLTAAGSDYRDACRDYDWRGWL